MLADGIEFCGTVHSHKIKCSSLTGSSSSLTNLPVCSANFYFPVTRCMIHPDTELRFINDEVGYGVFAVRPIPRGTLIWTLCLFDRIFPPAEAAALPPVYQEILRKY